MEASPVGRPRPELVARKRSGHTAVVEEGLLYVWGGYVLSGYFQMGVFWGWNNEVHIFDPMQASWSEPQTHNPRYHRSSGQIVAHTHSGIRQHLVPVWRSQFRLQTNELWHTACLGKNSDVIVFGGSCDDILLVDTVSITAEAGK
ncbi:hypothetical protein F2P81_003330 [Scophthalmus maximus]|uniref:Uncharacterized protein n=1 Tax=Scophthalmus maximus TaxID=52904 RepID=A0A6A4TQ86_SCOMX|nr:hypothetical protein F2P81_003330 [Scophthalmus maximus]